MSEKATGIALKRHPREKFFLATKLSNFSNYTRENSLAMYYQSFKELQVDYLDYYLLHSVGGGSGIQLVNDRYIDNGMLDFLVKERRRDVFVISDGRFTEMWMCLITCYPWM